MSLSEGTGFQPACVRLGIALSLIAVPAFAQRAPLFKSEIMPVLEKNCVMCHGDKQKMAGLDLSSFSGMMAGSSSGPVIAPGKPERSMLWKMIENDQMPQGGKLTAGEKQLIHAYIEQGRFPATEESEAAIQAREAAKITQKSREWWAFRKPVKAAVPEVKNKDQARTAIDAFILAKLEQKGWKMEPEADRVTLIRRAYLDLTGLPPTPAEVKAFVDDKSPKAWESLIDGLLASPHYGEQWGRHWLDVAGYSDSRGDAGDTDREVSWKYRDYVVNAFNKNKPIDLFLIEQMAGDQLVNYKPGSRPTPDQIEPLTATGFLRTTADITDNQTIYEVDKYFDAQQKAMETSLSATMGITIGCARCHDHKFDPLLQRDYYKLMSVYQAVWDPENWVAGSLNFGPWPSRMVLDMDDATRGSWIKDVTSSDAKAIRRMDDLLEATYQKYRAELKAGHELTPELRAQMRKDLEADPDLEVDRNVQKDFITDQEMEKRFPELAKWKDEVQLLRYNRRNKSKSGANFIEAAWDVSKTPSPTYILQRGNYLSPGAEVQPGIPMVLDNPENPLKFPDAKDHPDWNGTNRRLTLAKWMVSPENPLVPRVFVNRAWQWHFGEGIVRSVDDFGTQGAPPTHQELLDYLTVSFEQHNWDLKWLTKEIMMSQAYRQASTEVPQYMMADPSDKLLWRKAPVRLEAETIRDSMLQVSGLLNDKMFGKQEPIKRGPDGQWLEDDKKGSGNGRRSLYLAQTRTRSVAFLHVFDCPDMTSDNQAQRFRASLPTQSLALLNNPLVFRTTKALTQQVLERTNSNYDDAVKLAFDEAYNRPPSAKEMEIAKSSIAAEPDPKEGLRLFIQAMFGANDFLYSH
ncbi:MAG TPA: PSD1 and planctomycete cytochrome C domain-containing protein [Bryobacteraceae bacterium]|nr:PSD1 and planctomycete cytochrome C domain-containing protein [Bryobacteraceae bacterium]